MNRYLVFIGLALVEQIIMKILTKEIVHLQYEYISIKYSEFKFADKTDKPYGLNVILKLFGPVIYMVIIAGIFYEIGRHYLVEDIYLITIFYYFIRWINIIFILERKELNDWKKDIVVCTLGMILNLIVYQMFIIRTDRIFLSIDELREGVWLGIITFLFVLARNHMYNNIYVKAKESVNRKEKYILNKYKYFYNKYKNIIEENNKELESLIYSIMIYENYNRPPLFRVLEYIKCIASGEATLGVMQVKTKKIISNRTSVKQGCKIIEDNYDKYNVSIQNQDELISKILASYNGGSCYKDEVLYIREVIEEKLIRK